jgi:hypothetical protein
MFFRRRRAIRIPSKTPPKTPIETALTMISHATLIMYGYKHDTRYIPTDHDLKLFDVFIDELWQDYCTARYIQRCLYQRLRGEAEDQSPKTYIVVDR